MQIVKIKISLIFHVWVCLFWLLSSIFAENTQKIDFWSMQRKGANGALHRFRPEWFEAAASVGLEFIRFAPDQLPAAEKDFLIGDADHFTTLNETDFTLLEKILDTAHQHNIKIVLVMFSLPGCRWRQLNNDIDDFRLWQQDEFQQQAFSFWQQLALRLKDHPAIVGYNPLNEPHPGKMAGHEDPGTDFLEWLKNGKDTPADLNRFNRLMVQAIREVDPETPIILDSYFYADATGLPFTEPVADSRTLYAFHNIAPWVFAAFRINKGRFSYPDKMPEGQNAVDVPWTLKNLAERVTPVLNFASKYNIPSSRIIASEFWCDRRVSGCREYMADAIKIYNGHGWHWAFYDFRSDGDWGGLDYELGDNPKLGWKFWQAVESGEDADAYKNRHDNPIWEVIRREFEEIKKDEAVTAD